MKFFLPTLSLLVLGIGLMTFMSTPAYASAGSDIVTSEICKVDPTACAADQSTIGKIITTVVQILVFVIVGISVIVIVIAGLMYVLSGGDSNNTKRAKDAIMYAIIGLAVALVAQGLVSFVLSKL